MSNFKKGDIVRLVQITDIDAELDDPKRVIKNDADIAEAGFGDSVHIGMVGIVTDPAINDYYDLIVEMDGETYAMMNADLELVAGETFRVVANVPKHEHSGKRVFMHDPELTDIHGPTTVGTREISVTTRSKDIAAEFVGIYQRLFGNAKVTLV
jgi:hypothetical protein